MGRRGSSAISSRTPSTALVDATHPFSARMPFNAAAAARAAGVPRVRVLRPPWSPQAGDRWTAVLSVTEAAAAVEASGAGNVLLTIGRQELAPFAACGRARLVARCIDPPDAGVLDRAEIILARGPFTVEDEVDAAAPPPDRPRRLQERRRSGHRGEAGGGPSPRPARRHGAAAARA